MRTRLVQLRVPVVGDWHWKMVLLLLFGELAFECLRRLGAVRARDVVVCVDVLLFLMAERRQPLVVLADIQSPLLVVVIWLRILHGFHASLGTRLNRQIKIGQIRDGAMKAWTSRFSVLPFACPFSNQIFLKFLLIFISAFEN